jgi:hypothetical protein
MAATSAPTKDAGNTASSPTVRMSPMALPTTSPMAEPTTHPTAIQMASCQ